MVTSAVPVSLSANDSLLSPVSVLHSSPKNDGEKSPQNGRGPTSWSGTTQAQGRDRGGNEEVEEVFTPNVPCKSPSNSYKRQETREKYELKAWPRKPRRFRSVVDTVKSFRCSTAPDVPASFSGVENTSGPGESTEQKMEGKDKTRSTSSVQKGNSIRKKFPFLRGRQRSISEGHLSVLYSSQDDMDPLLKRKNGTETDGSKNRVKKLLRRSSENITGSTTLSRQRSAEKCFHSLPNSPVTITSSGNRSKRFAGARDSRSTASCSSNSHASSTTQDKCPMCDFNVLILSECPDCQVSQQGDTNSSFQERLIL